MQPLAQLDPLPEGNPLYEYPNMFAEHGEAVARAFLNSENSPNSPPKSRFVPANASPTTMAQINEAMEKENREIAEEMQRTEEEKEQMNRDMSLARRIENALSNISNKPLYNDKSSKFVPKNASANILAEIEQSERKERRRKRRKEKEEKEQINRNASLARKLNTSSKSMLKSRLKSRLNAKNKSAKPNSNKSKFIPKSASNSIMAEIHKAEEKEKKEKENRERGNRQMAEEMERAEREQMIRNASLARRLQNNRSRSPNARRSNARRFRVSSIFNKHIPRAFSRIFRR